MTFSARRATASDLPAIEAITWSAYEGYTAVLGREPLPMRTDHAHFVAAGQVWMVGDDALCVLEPGPDHLMVFSLAVRPGGQGAGIGRWMLGFAEEQARRAGLGEVRLYTNARMTRNLGIYARAGYRETGRRAPDADWPGWFVVDMAKAV